MTSRAKIVLAIAFGLLAYGGFIWAHRRYDYRPAAPAAPKAVDVGLVFERLLEDGLACAPEIEAGLAIPGDEAATRTLRSVLPNPRKLWVRRLEDLRQGTATKPASVPARLEFVEPRGRMLAGVPTLFLTAPAPSLVDVSLRDVLAAPGSPALATVEWAVTRRRRAPESFAVATGKSYRLEATMREAPHLSATIEISTLTRAEEDAYRRTFEVLKRHIADTRVRLFTHILAALDAELWSTAVDLLASFPKEGAAKRLGLDECRRAVDDAFGEAASLRAVIEALSR